MMLLSTVLAVTCCLPNQAEPPERNWTKLAPEQGFSIDGREGKVVIKVPKIMRKGKTFDVSVTFFNTGQSAYQTYNRGLNPHYPAPGWITIYDDTGASRGNLVKPLWSHRISSYRTMPENWCTIDAGRKVSQTVECRLLSEAAESKDRLPPLEPGGYKVQLIYMEMLLAPCPYDIQPADCDAPEAVKKAAYMKNLSFALIDRENKEFFKSFQKQELCRSNVQTLIVLPEEEPEVQEPPAE